MPSPAKSSKATAPLTGTAPVGTASGKRSYDVASAAACNVGTINPENMPVAPNSPTEPTVEQLDHPSNEMFCDSKGIHSDIPQNLDVAPNPIPSGDTATLPAEVLPSVGRGINSDVINALHQPDQANIPQVCLPPTYGEVPSRRQLSEDGSSLVPQDIASALVPAPRPASNLRQHVSFANSGFLQGDTKSSATGSAETSRTTSCRRFFSEATGSGMAKRVSIVGVCLACVAMLSFSVFYAIAEVVIVSHEFVSEIGDPGTVRPQDEGALDLPPRLLSHPSGFQRTETAGPQDGTLAVPAERVPGNDTSTEDFTDAVESG